MRKFWKPMVAALAVTLAASPSSVMAEGGDPCGMIACMSKGIMEAPDECKSDIEAYFSIRVFKKGKFQPVPTSIKRLAKLKQCAPIAMPEADIINAQFGTLFASPFSLYGVNGITDGVTDFASSLGNFSFDATTAVGGAMDGISNGFKGGMPTASSGAGNASGGNGMSSGNMNFSSSQFGSFKFGDGGATGGLTPPEPGGQQGGFGFGPTSK